MLGDLIAARKERGRPRLVTGTFILITLSTFAYFLSVGMLLPTLPRYVEGPLQGGSVAVGLVVGAFAVSAVLLRPFIGGMGDRRGRRVLMVGGAAIVAGSVALYAATTSLWPMVLLRLATGVGEAAFYVGAASAINDLAPDERRGEAVSYFSLALYSGLALGPVVGEMVLDAGDFTATWLAAAAAGAVAAAIGWRVPETRPESEMQVEGGRSLLFHRAGLMPGTILATQIWGLSGFSAFIPLYALQVGLSGSRAVFATFSVVVLLIRSFGARIPDLLGPRRAATIALTTSATALTLMSIWDEPAGLFVGAFVFGIGQALAFPALMTLALSGAPPSERGAVVGTFTAFFDLSFGLGAVASGAIAALLGYEGAFLGAAVVAGGGILLMHFYDGRAERAARREEVLESA